MTIKIMYQQGYSKKRIARELGISINTVRKHLSLEEQGYSCRPAKALKLDDYRDYICKRLQQASPHWIRATVLYEEIKRQGYEGKLSLLRHYLRCLKPVIKEEPIIRFETEPVQQMQVDWACFARGKERLSAFIATLGYSRASYVEFVTDETLGTLLQCHEHAFSYFGGVPHEALYDNMKTIITQRNAYGLGLHRLQSGFWDFAKHYGFIPRVCKPYRAQTKGKVERFIHYLRYSFYYPLLGELKQSGLKIDKELANQKVILLVRASSNQRVHGTTEEKPCDRLILEQTKLQNIPYPYQGHLVDKEHEPRTIWTPQVHDLATTSLQHELSIYDELSFNTQGIH